MKMMEIQFSLCIFYIRNGETTQPEGREDGTFRSAGGSSGGSAAAVAASLCDG